MLQWIYGVLCCIQKLEEEKNLAVSTVIFTIHILHHTEINLIRKLKTGEKRWGQWESSVSVSHSAIGPTHVWHTYIIEGFLYWFNVSTGKIYLLEHISGAVGYRGFLKAFADTNWDPLMFGLYIDTYAENM